MIRASLGGVTVAETERTVIVEGNHYFPRASVRFEYLRRARLKTLCFWKGVANYYNLTAGGATVANGAWTYRHPSPLARRITNHVAFTGDITIAEVLIDEPAREAATPYSCPTGEPS